MSGDSVIMWTGCHTGALGPATSRLEQETNVKILGRAIPVAGEGPQSPKAKVSGKRGRGETHFLFVSLSWRHHIHYSWEFRLELVIQQI